MKKPNIVNMRFGSHLYGLATENSDVDYKGLYLPTLPELLLGTYPKTTKISTGEAHEKNQAGDVDIEVMSLPRFVELGVQGETLVIDMLHCNEPMWTSDIWESLVVHRTRFYSKNLKAFVGYVKRQAAKYGIKGSRLADVRKALNVLHETMNIPAKEHPVKMGDIWWKLYEGEFAKKIEQDGMYFYEVNGKKYQSTVPVNVVSNALMSMWSNYGHRAKQAEQNEGVDWKAVSHALRAAYQARDIYLEGDFEYPLKETDFLLDVKLGKLDYKSEVGPELEAVVDQVERLSAISTLPERVDRKFWNDWLLMVYDENFNIKSFDPES